MAERLMREHGLRVRHRRRYKVTTDSKRGLPVADDLLDRNFQPSAANPVWRSDIAYLWTAEGGPCLAIVMDWFNREIDGWSLQPRMTAEIVTDVLTMAWFRRRPAPGLLHHSDRGGEYASHADMRTASFVAPPSMKPTLWKTKNRGRLSEGLRLEQEHLSFGWVQERIDQLLRAD